jgi:geranylgeranyl diphosphate synthase type II
VTVAPTPPSESTASRSSQAALAFLGDARVRVEAWLDRVLPPPEGGPPRLGEAMRYAVFAGGKRLRPALAMAACRAVGGDDARALPFGAALELVHTYSLVHDDLPSMDDDDLRRGRPTCHRVFGEAMAVLTGDAMHTLAFECLLDPSLPADLARDLGIELARAAGPAGMVGGQVEDLAATAGEPSVERLTRIQTGKTAALLVAACRGGGRIGGAAPAALEALARYGLDLGLAFQMVDDVLDVTGTAETLGKTPGKDEEEERMTWVTLEGVGGAMARAERHVASALAAVRDLPGRDLLAALAHFVTRRDR